MTEPQPGPEPEQNRPGVRQIEVDSESAGTRLDAFLMRLLPSVPRSRVFRIVRKGEVRVNGKRAAPEQRLQERDIVRVPPIRIEAEPGPGEPVRVSSRARESIESAIISEDDRLIVINKPAGVAVHGGSGLSFGVIEALRAMRPDEELELVHRLDRETSGCLLVARRRSALRTLHELMRGEGLVEKRYLTLVKGHWNLGHTRVDAPLRTDTRVGGERTVKVHSSGKEAISEFKPIQWFGNRATLLEVSLLTGRTHQIRVHAAHAGHPVAGDEKYGDEAFNEEMKEMGLHRMFLHSHSISFEWPQGAHGGLFSASAPLPEELSAVIDALSSGKLKSTTRPARWGSKDTSAQKSRSRPREDLPDDAHAEPRSGSTQRPGARSNQSSRSPSASRDSRAKPGGRRAGRQRMGAKAGADRKSRADGGTRGHSGGVRAGGNRPAGGRGKPRSRAGR